MKQRINLLILFSGMVLLILIALQYYLVHTAYHHQVSQFRLEIKEKIAKVTDDYAQIDPEIFIKKDQLYKTLANDFIADQRVRTSISIILRDNLYKDELTRKLESEFNKEMPDLKIKFAVILNKFVIIDNTKPADTIYAEQPAIENRMYGNMQTLDGAFSVRNYVGTTSTSRADSDLKFLTEDSLFVSVADSEMIILRRMSAMLIVAILSICTLVTLFIVAIRALIRQKKLNDIKTDLINNITHELKTPLSTLSVSTQILQRPDIRANDKVFLEVIDTISRQNLRLQHLVDQVMANSVGFEDIELQKELVSAQALIREIVADFKRGAHSVSIGTQFDATDTILSLDKFHLTTAIVNVLENAVKYGCTSIVISGHNKNGQLHICIQDDGIGIERSKQPLLFDKFYRVKEGNLHNTRGLGLGLYYVRQILKAHHGTVNVSSEPGRGALFTISLPTI